ncbi:50S ribosomal protein L24 [Oribacterium sp. oral taxon 102]|uniref:50S ribosomal protein L24 n=1 Tax=Oribacterium sp. oral taxon 102 TaxID=671214 RepID=UPI0015BCBF26|nr:50S ribosomal protein L24 [Oribacterium sp. oral taxon 102]NWO20907.1 50S ribosomal protein L24 [Oribacterium sp. oral taxon 102]
MRRIKKDDIVKIIAGKDSGKQGKVLSFDPKTNRVVVEGCNMVTKHQKPNQTNAQGGILHKEASIDASNVMLVVDGQATRIGFELRDGKKVRVAKKSGKVID